MSSSAELVHIEKIILGFNLNSNLLLVFGVGVYTTVYIGTVCLYLIQKANRSWTIIGALTVLFGVTIAQLAIQWQSLQFIFVDNGDTRDTMYNASFFGDVTAQFASTILFYCGNILADGILLWRCYYMCGISLRRISIPLFFFTAEIGLMIASTVLQGILTFQPDHINAQTDNVAAIVDGTANAVTAVTTTLATFIICRRIIISSTDTKRLFDRRYNKITRILIESASIYSVTAILLAIGDFLTLSESSNNGLAIVGLANYVPVLAIIVTGIAPTLTVAQVCISSVLSRDATSVQAPSGLDFHVQSTVQHASHPSSGENISSIRDNTSQMNKESV